jgi:hypothetical protein
MSQGARGRGFAVFFVPFGLAELIQAAGEACLTQA